MKENEPGSVKNSDRITYHVMIGFFASPGILFLAVFPFLSPNNITEDTDTKGIMLMMWFTISVLMLILLSFLYIYQMQKVINRMSVHEGILQIKCLRKMYDVPISGIRGIYIDHSRNVSLYLKDGKWYGFMFVSEDVVKFLMKIVEENDLPEVDEKMFNRYQNAKRLN